MKKQRERNNRFIVVCFFLVFFQVSEAQTTDFKKVTFSIKDQHPSSGLFSQSFQKFRSFDFNFMNNGNYAAAKPAHLPVSNMLTSDFYAQHLGYFCKKEWQFEKSSGIPFRFRLGSLDDCNHLEGKR